MLLNGRLESKVRHDLKVLLNGCLEPIFIENNFDKKKNVIVGLIYRHPHMPINDFCDNFLIECLNKIVLLDNTCILMGDFYIDLLRSHANIVTSKFLEVRNSFFLCSLYSGFYTRCRFIRDTNRQYFHEFC